MQGTSCMRMKRPCVTQGFMGVHGADSGSCIALSEAETALHAHLSNHAWRCMGTSGPQ